MKIVELTLKMVVKVPENTDLNDLMFDITDPVGPNLEVFTNGGRKKVRHTIPSWALAVKGKHKL